MYYIRLQHTQKINSVDSSTLSIQFQTTLTSLWKESFHRITVTFHCQILHHIPSVKSKLMLQIYVCYNKGANNNNNISQFAQKVSLDDFFSEELWISNTSWKFVFVIPKPPPLPKKEEEIIYLCPYSPEKSHSLMHIHNFDVVCMQNIHIIWNKLKL